MNDLSSRQAAIDALEKVAELYPWRVLGDRDSYSQYNEAWQDALNRADSEIEALPSAQTERKKGKWTIYDRHTIPYQYICSECGTYYHTRYDFCPTCGADMRENK